MHEVIYEKNCVSVVSSVGTSIFFVSRAIGVT